MTNEVPLVVIVGVGFGGLAAAKALRRAPVNILLIDRSNHHVFQPLLYQVGTSVLAPGQIASPLRGLLADQENTSVMLGNATGIDPATRHVIVDAGEKKGLRVRMTIWCSRQGLPTATLDMMSSPTSLQD
jgi:NADH dehydrogenase